MGQCRQWVPCVSTPNLSTPLCGSYGGPAPLPTATTGLAEARTSGGVSEFPITRKRHEGAARLSSTEADTATIFSVLFRWIQPPPLEFAEQHRIGFVRSKSTSQPSQELMAEPFARMCPIIVWPSQCRFATDRMPATPSGRWWASQRAAKGTPLETGGARPTSLFSKTWPS